jgi:hypothetical protein
MYSFLALVFKVCKMCYYDHKKGFFENINMGINKPKCYALLKIWAQDS